jgi:CxxC-x17-CxxC domain-containing protein
MYNNKFSRDRKPGGWKGGKSFGGDRGGFKTMHPATCEKCGSRCEVPFKPNGRKPVFCSNCFVRDESRDSRPSFDRRDARPSFGGSPDVSAQLKAINEKLDMIIEALGE